MDGKRTESPRPEGTQAFGSLLVGRDDAALTTRPFHDSVAASSVPIVVIDGHATVRLWNRTAERIFGCSRTQVVDGSIPIIPFEQRDVLPDRDTAGIRAIVRMPTGDRRTTTAGDLGIGRSLQALTDACRLIAGADFGATSFNVADEAGGHYLLHALSWRPQEGSDPVPMHRSTIGFAPLSGGDVNVHADVTPGRWYDRKLPHERAWAALETVDGFLALPILGDAGEVRGGLFLAHPDPDVFTTESQRIVVALAESAGTAIDNACLYAAERRAHTAAKSANHSGDDFMAVLGHELRNPLSTVRDGIATARLDPAHSDRALELAEHGAEQLNRLMDDLLDIARVTHGKIILRRAVVSLAQIADRAVDSARHQVEARGHTIAVSLLEGNFQVDGDALRLEQVIGNLLSNASKYMDPGGHIAVAVAHEDSEVVVRVRDTGIGIAPEALPRIFDLFAQAKQSPNRAQGGLGIGLALVKRLVELHGGRVEAHSDGCGTGTEIVMRLPAVAAPSPIAPIEVCLRLADRPAAHVLVVDDQAESAELTAKLLKTRGHRVRTALDGPSALQAALADPPDVMLVDIGLPGMDGYQVVQSVRQHPRLRHVRLVALTGYGREEDRQRALAAGFDNHLVKPVNLEELFGLVARLAAPKPPRMPSADSANSSSTTTPAATARAAFRLVDAKRRSHVPQENTEAPQIEATSRGEAIATDDVSRGPGSVRRNSEGRPQPGKIDR